MFMRSCESTSSMREDDPGYAASDGIRPRSGDFGSRYAQIHHCRYLADVLGKWVLEREIGETQRRIDRKSVV